MNKPITFYCIAHKEFPLHAKDRIVIAVGPNQMNLPYPVKDSTGDSIAEKNPNYCELTALYWIWKNDPSAPDDYISFEHYRRYFSKKGTFKAIPVTKEELEPILEKKDGVVSIYYTFKKSIREVYQNHHYVSDLDVCLDVIKEKYPDYVEDFNTFMKGKKAVMLNMFILQKKYVDQYCAWVFDVLGEVERRIDISDRDDYQKRVYGFLSERLFNVWLNHNLKNLYHMDIQDCYANRFKENTITMLRHLLGRNK